MGEEIVGYETSDLKEFYNLSRASDGNFKSLRIFIKKIKIQIQIKISLNKLNKVNQQTESKNIST